MNGGGVDGAIEEYKREKKEYEEGEELDYIEMRCCDGLREEH